VASPAPGTTAVPAGARPPGLLRFDPGAWTAPATVPPAEQGSWRLVVRRGLYDHGTLVQSARSLAPLARPQQLWLGAEELERLGVVPGDRVRVRSPRGELVLPVTADAGVPSGVALVQFNAAPIYEASASALIDCSSPVVEVRLETVS
jgi:formate dehydrogenase major subunit